MNRQIIIYGSQYGSARRYAERLAELTGMEAVSYKDAKNIGDYDRIVYLGGIFAGGVLGLKQTVGKMSDRQELVVATVGMTDPGESAYFESIRKSMESQLPANLYDAGKIFHLRGAIDYSHLKFMHRFMMKMFHSMMLKKPESELTADARAMLETYGKKVDFVDFSALNPLVEMLQSY